MPPSNEVPRPSALIVSEQGDLQSQVRDLLQENHWTVKTTPLGSEALMLMVSHKFDVVVIDRLFRDGVSLDLHRRIQRLGPPMPAVILVSDRNDEIERVVAFELGADDFVQRPFHPRELVLRIKARAAPPIPSHTTSHAAPSPPQRIEAGPLAIDAQGGRVQLEGKPLELTPIELHLLVTLASAQGGVVPRDRLRTEIWPFAPRMSDRTVDKHVQRLRDKLGQARNLIRTVRGLGYQLST